MATALITGASGGIGEELARLFAADKYDLILVARSADRLAAIADRLSAEYGVSALAVPCDLTKSGAAGNLHSLLAEGGRQVDLLVNNAGFGDFGPFMENELKRADDMVALNCVALMDMCRLFGADMAERGRGQILNISSIAAFQPGPYMAVYYATKAFVQSLSESLCRELEGAGVAVTTVCPGPTTSGFVKASNMESCALFGNIKPNTAEYTAREAYRALKKGKAVHIPGLRNKLLVFATRFGSRKTLRNTACSINTKHK